MFMFLWFTFDDSCFIFFYFFFFFSSRRRHTRSLCDWSSDVCSSDLKGRVIAIVTEGDTHIPKMSEFVIEVPSTLDALMPMISVIPLQLLSYHIAVMRGCNVDQPRNLAKSVTVE